MEATNELKNEKEVEDYRAKIASELWEEKVDPVELPPKDEVEDEEGQEIVQEAQAEQDEAPEQENEAGQEEPTLSDVLKAMNDLSYRVGQAEKRVGSVQNAIQNPQAKKEEAETPSRDEIKAAVLDEDKWSEMVDNYPEFEEPLSFIKSSIAEIIDRTGPTIDEKIGAINKNIDNRIADHSRDVEIKFVARAHPDWAEVKDSKEFADWVHSQPLEEQDKIAKSSDALEVIRILDNYKKSTAGVRQEEQQDLSEVRQQRLDRSVTPQVRGKPTKSKAVEDMTDEEYREYVANRYDEI